MITGSAAVLAAFDEPTSSFLRIHEGPAAVGQCAGMGGHFGGAAPIIATFDTTCFYDQPPWSYTIAPNTSISFGISVNASGSCFFTPSTGTVAIAEPNTGAEDTISFHNDYPNGVALNCGNYDPITSGTIDVQNTYEFDYGNPFVGNEYTIYPNTCSWDGSAYLK